MPTNQDTLVSVRVTVEGSTKRFMLPLRTMAANTLLFQLRRLLNVDPSDDVVFARYSDSAGGYVRLDPRDDAVFKQLYRAAKAKLKLRIRANVMPSKPLNATVEDDVPGAIEDMPSWVVKTPVASQNGSKAGSNEKPTEASKAGSNEKPTEASKAAKDSEPKQKTAEHASSESKQADKTRDARSEALSAVLGRHCGSGPADFDRALAVDLGLLPAEQKQTEEPLASSGKAKAEAFDVVQEVQALRAANYLEGMEVLEKRPRQDERRQMHEAEMVRLQDFTQYNQQIQRDAKASSTVDETKEIMDKLALFDEPVKSDIEASHKGKEVQRDEYSSAFRENKDALDDIAQYDEMIERDAEASRIASAQRLDEIEMMEADRNAKRAEAKKVEEELRALTNRKPLGTIVCNNCEAVIKDEHFHCSVCDGGDYDLCHTCVDLGVVCHSAEHWLVKCHFDDAGLPVRSTTQTHPARAETAKEPETETAEETEAETAVEPEAETTGYELNCRTCNHCVRDYVESECITCVDCADYDLCLDCHEHVMHGHNPSHTFAPVLPDMQLEPLARALLGPGRNAQHNAECDRCDKKIYGVRHKCLDCPDWDYCSACIHMAAWEHPNHRFIPLYERGMTPSMTTWPAVHHGVFCDGELCKGGVRMGSAGYITGERYKCTVCHDTDFCAKCEASPNNAHNRTHPLIKFKTPVRSVSVNTMGDDRDGRPMPIMGDRREGAERAVNAATQVQTVADVQPTEKVETEAETEAEAEAQPEAEAEPEVKSEPEVKAAKPKGKPQLAAEFVRKTVEDGTRVSPNETVELTWVVRNSGNVPWPVYCQVCPATSDHRTLKDERIHLFSNVNFQKVMPGEEFEFTVSTQFDGWETNEEAVWNLLTPTGDVLVEELYCSLMVYYSEGEKLRAAEDWTPTPEYAGGDWNTPVDVDGNVIKNDEENVNENGEEHPEPAEGWDTDDENTKGAEGWTQNGEQDPRPAEGWDTDDEENTKGAEGWTQNGEQDPKPAEGWDTDDEETVDKNGEEEPKPAEDWDYDEENGEGNGENGEEGVDEEAAEEDFGNGNYDDDGVYLEGDGGRCMACVWALEAAAARKEERETRESQLVFPAIENETPENETPVNETPENDTPETETPETAESAPAAPADEEFIDFMSEAGETAEGAASEDGFLTDEEYDVLDVSDQEYEQGKK